MQGGAVWKKSFNLDHSSAEGRTAGLWLDSILKVVSNLNSTMILFVYNLNASTIGKLFIVVPLFQWVPWMLSLFFGSLYMHTNIRFSKRGYKHTLWYGTKQMVLLKRPLALSNFTHWQEFFQLRLWRNFFPKIEF